MSVGEWLNNVIEPEDKADDEPTLLFEEDDELDDERPRRSRDYGRDGDRDQGERRHERDQRRSERDERRRDEDEQRRAAFDRESERTRSQLNEVHSRLDRLSHQLERMARSEAVARRAPLQPPPPPPAQPPRRRPPFNGDTSDTANGRLTGAPAQPRRPAERLAAAARRQPPVAAEADGGVSIDEAVAEITARQRVLDGDAAPELAPGMAPELAQEAPATPREAPKPYLDLPEAPPESPKPHLEAPEPRRLASELPRRAPDDFHEVPEGLLHAKEPPVVDISGLDRQLREITARIEALRPSSELESSVAAIRSDLTEIAHLITEALPRRAVESLEIEVKALGQRIEHGRQCGVDGDAIAGLERGLDEVRDALRGLTPAENLIGFDAAIKALSQKVDMIVANDDPAALQQLETAIGALRGIVSHVASNETLTKVAEDVRALAGKIDGFANMAASDVGLSAIEQRIETLTNALSASTEAGHAVPRELEKLFSGLIEKLEWVQLTHTDHAALAHLEDRIATLVQRFDASDARLNHLEAIERGIADLLVHIDQIRTMAGDGTAARLTPATNSVSAIERDVAQIKQSEQRTQDSLEAVQGTVEHVVDRLAVIESGFREQTSHSAAPPPPLPTTHDPAEAPKVQEFAAEPSTTGAPTEPTVQRAAPRKPIDPSLPPDHPLEPGSASGRRPASAADRIAASEAAIESGKPPVIPDPGQKSNFIAAARRAAQAAAAAPAAQATAKGAAAPKQDRNRSRPLIIAAAAALILLGCLHIASRLFESAPPPAPPPQAQPEKSAAPATPPAEPTPPAAVQPEAAPPTPPAASPPPQLPNAPPAAAPAPSPAPEPNPKSGAVIAPKPAHQATAPQADAGADVTGALPHPATAAPAPLGDKLPASIGGPTLRAAALSGDGAAAYEVGMRFAEGRGVARSNEEAALWFERAAKQGVAPAQFRLGGFYEKGIGVKKNLAAARDLYLAAAQKGNGKAMHNLAVLYAEGIEGPADYANAAHWFREAADHGIMDSQYNLGILYARGVGVAQNYAESYKWFALAAMAGDQDATKKCDEVASHLDQQSLAAARLAVKTWTARPQPDDAVNVKAPPAGWDATASAAPARAKPQQPSAIKPPAQSAKIN